MGTNYYLYEKPPCPTCGHQAEPLHIGKSSAGWCFSLHVIPDRGLTSLQAWEKEWSRPGVEIKDEYGQTIHTGEMWRIVTDREHVGGQPGWTMLDYSRNSAQPGPRGLVRFRIDGQHCVGHGDGTWDLIAANFS